MEGHLRRIAEEGYTILENAVEPDFIDEIADALKEGRSLNWGGFRRTISSRACARLACTTSWSTARPLRSPVHPDVLPVIKRVLDPGALISSLSSIAIGPGEQRPADPRG